MRRLIIFWVWSSLGFCEDGGEHLDTAKPGRFFFDSVCTDFSNYRGVLCEGHRSYSQMYLILLVLARNAAWRSWIFHQAEHLFADPGGRTVKGVGLRPRACWDCVFEPHRGMAFCLVCVFSFQVEVSRRADHSSRGVLPTAMRRCVWSRNPANEEALAHCGGGGGGCSKY